MFNCCALLFAVCEMTFLKNLAFNKIQTLVQGKLEDVTNLNEKQNVYLFRRHKQSYFIYFEIEYRYLHQFDHTIL